VNQSTVFIYLIIIKGARVPWFGSSVGRFAKKSTPNNKGSKGFMVWFFRRTQKNLCLIIKGARVPWFGSSVGRFAKKPYLILWINPHYLSTNKTKKQLLGISTRNHSKIGGCHFCSLAPCSNLHLIPSFFDGALPGIRAARKWWCVPLGSAWPRGDPPTSPPPTRLR
jgi:hypothetical protein